MDDGRLPATGGTLKAPRSAVEYGAPTTGAHGGERVFLDGERRACGATERHAMRFDDDALRFFGPGLVGPTATPEFIPNSDSYGARGPGTIATPAAVAEGLTPIL